MDIYAGLLFIISEIALVISVLIFIIQPKLQIYRVLSTYSLLTALISYALFSYINAESSEDAYFWFHFAGIGYLQPAIMLHLTFSFIGYNNFLKKTNNFLAVYAPAVLMIFLFLYSGGHDVELIHQDSQWKIESIGNIVLAITSLAWVSLFNVISSWLILRYATKIKVEPKKTQARLFLFGVVVSTIFWLFLFIFQLLYPYSAFKLEYFSIGLLLEIIIFAFALTKYRLISYEFKDIVDDVMSATSNIVAIIKPNGHIVKINSAVERLLDISPSEFEGSSFNKLLYFGNEKEGWNSILERISSRSDETKIELEFRNRSAEKIPVLASFKPVSELGILKGFSMIAEDAREIRRYQDEIQSKDLLLEKEREIRKISSDLYLKIREAGGFNLSYVLEDVLSTVRNTIGLADVYIVMGKKIVSDPDLSFSTFISTNIKNGEQLEKELRKLGINYEKFMLSNDPKLDYTFLIAVPSGANKKLSIENHQHLRTISNSIGAALENTILGVKNEALGSIADRVVYIESEEFYKIASDLNGDPFEATYLVADLADSVNLKIHQDELQTLLKDILKSHGAVWGNSWGDMVHAVFSDRFKRENVPAQIRAYLCAIEICQSVKDHFDAVMKVGVASGPISISKDTSQMNQDEDLRIIEKSALAQEGRPGVSTLQQPSPQLVQKLEEENWSFIQTKDLVRGTVKDVWRLQRNNGVIKIVESSKDTGSQTLNYDASIHVLLTKGVDGHEHFEGGVLSPAIIKIIRKAAKYFNENPEHNERFLKLTGKSSLEVVKMLDEIESWGENRQSFDFQEHFLPWLYVAKLAEASNPDIIYELTKAQLTHDLALNSGVTKEIYPLVWLEMGMEYRACIEAFVSGVEDALRSNLITGPVKIGVGVKRQHLVKSIANSAFPEVSSLEYPYMSYLKLVERLKQSSMLDTSEIFVDVIDMEKLHPLFSYNGVPDRSDHTKALFKATKELGARTFVHTLESPFDENLAPDLPRDYEFSFIVELLEDLGITNPRFIHMAYWSANLPLLNRLKAMGAEIATCTTSTEMLGSTHKPASPFLMKKRNVVEGIIYDPHFPRVLVATDDSGPFTIRSVWEEMEVLYNNLKEWFDKETASLALIQLLRNSYENIPPNQISELYKLDQRAVEWVMAYDLYSDKSELKLNEIKEKIIKRADEILMKRQNLLNK